jgi:hypothetical protein
MTIVVGSPFADSGSGGGVVLATQQEAFDLNAVKASSPATVYGSGWIQKHNIANKEVGLGIVLAAGATYNLFTPFLEANEQRIGEAPVFKTIDPETVQLTMLDEVNNKYLFPSNENTYNTSYVEFKFRVILTIDHAAVGSNATTTLKVGLYRALDDSEITASEVRLTDVSARNGYKFTEEFTTWVNSEADPFVVDGMYVRIENEAGSSGSVTLQEDDIDMFKR